MLSLNLINVDVSSEHSIGEKPTEWMHAGQDWLVEECRVHKEQAPG